MKRFWDKVEKRGESECWNWGASQDPDGYGHFKFDGKVERAHRMAYRLTVGDIPAGLVVMHACDNPACCNPAHLSLGTKSENSQDAVAKGRQKNLGVKGFPNRNTAKLTELQVRRIRIAAGALSQNVLAKIMGVSQSAISRIQRGNRWGGVQ